MSFLYNKAALGGTFDHLHLGHQVLINTALNSAQQVVIGLTTESLVSHKLHKQSLQSYSKRLVNLTQYLKSINSFSRVSLIPLEDVYGPTLEDTTLDCLVVSEQTKGGAVFINHRRQELQLPKLPIITAPMQLDESGQYISSSRIRNGQINRQGLIFSNLFTHDLHPNSAQRLFLGQNHGQIFTQINAKQIRSWTSPTVLVGDYVTQWWLKNDLPFTHAIVDGHSQKQPIDLDLDALNHWPSFKTINLSGTVSPTAAKSVQHLLTLPNGLLWVEGEEDLLSLPAYLSLSLNSHLIYGQPNQGMVVLKSTLSFKQKLYYLFKSNLE